MPRKHMGARIVCGFILAGWLALTGGRLSAWDYHPPYGLAWRPQLTSQLAPGDKVWALSDYGDPSFVPKHTDNTLTLLAEHDLTVSDTGLLLQGGTKAFRLPAAPEKQPQVRLTRSESLSWSRPFVLEWVARMEGEDMTWSAPSGLSVRFSSYRAGGQWIVSLPAEAKRAEFNQSIADILKDVSPAVFSCFRRYTMAWNGRDNLRLFIDGQLTGSMTMPAPSGEWREFIYSAPGSWLAEVRFNTSLGALPVAAKPEPASAPADIQRTGFVGFQMGPATALRAPGYHLVTEETPTGAERPEGFGFDTPPSSSFQNWYQPGWFGNKPVEILANGSARAIPELWRTGLMVPVGTKFTVKLPEGRYWIAVTLGSPLHNTHEGKVTVNGKLLGEKLRTSISAEHQPRHRTARNEINNTTGSLVFKFDGDTSINRQNEPLVCVQAIEIRPAGIPSFAYKNSQLEWRRKDGPAPVQLPEINRLLAEGRGRDAITVARQIKAEIDRLELFAWILGYPAVPEKWQAELLDEITVSLEKRLQKDSSDARVLNLWEASRRFAPALQNYVNSALSETVAGNPIVQTFDQANLAQEFTASEPYFGLARFLLASTIYWYTAETRRNDPLLPRTGQALEPALKLFPDNRLYALMGGRDVPAPPLTGIPAGAPRWAKLDLQVLLRAQQITHYWIDERMDERGLMGGGLGDDVEMLRGWSFLMAATGDEKILAGWRKLADTAWASSGKTGGYPSVEDAEHASEPISDTLTFLPLLEWGGPRYQEALDRQRQVFKLARDLWTVKLPDGSRMFRSSSFSATAVDPQRARDWVYCIRAVQPVLTCAWLTRDPEMIKFICELATSWREAILAERNGKPAGLSPHLITWPDRSFVLGSKTWYDSAVYGVIKSPLYHTEVYNLLLAAYELSGDSKYLDPLRAGVKLLQANPPPASEAARLELPAGSLAWLLYGYPLQFDDPSGKGGKTPVRWLTGANVLLDAAARARLVAPQAEFDQVLSSSPQAVARFLIAWRAAREPADRQQVLDELCAVLEPMAQVTEKNVELSTTLARSTDRVYLPLAETFRALATGETSGVPHFETQRERSWPLASVFWRTGGAPLAAWVVDQGPTYLEALLYQPAAESRTITARLWRLKPGTYRIIREENGVKQLATTFQVKGPGTDLPLQLPGQTEVRLRIELQ